MRWYGQRVRRPGTAAVLAAVLAAGTGCGTGPGAGTVAAHHAVADPSGTRAAVPPGATVTPGATADAGLPATPAVPAFTASTGTVTAADLPHSWRPGCPVGPAGLRRVRLVYWGFDGRPHTGTLVVAQAVVTDVVTVFRGLYRQRFPIRSMRPVDDFDASDPASMAADNTSAFNCRYAVAPGSPAWSAHAYGTAIDVNTVENPYLDRGSVLPPAGRAYLDRSAYRPGMAVPGGVLVAAFAAAGWSWGGRWSTAPDYQHFSRSGG